jgi:hypothetical protein
MPNDSLHLPRLGGFKVVVEKVGSRQRRIVANQGLEARVLAIKDPVAKGAAVVEMRMRVDERQLVEVTGGCHERPNKLPSFADFCLASNRCYEPT